MAVNSIVKIGIAGSLGAVLCAVGAILYILLPNIIKDKVYETFRLINGTDTYKRWEEVPVPIYMQFYFFNVTNADEISANNTVKPVLQQLGPYTYREHRKKVNIFFNEKNGTVSYDLLKWYIFEPNMTKGSLEDSITTINIPLIAMATITETEFSAFHKMIINIMMRKFQSTMFITKTVDELLFRGYVDDLMIVLAEKAKREILPNGTFGLYYNKNYTDNKEDAVYVVNTGLISNNNFLNIVTWNRSNSLPFWNDTYCNMINGSDLTSFSTFRKKEERIYGYDPDLCRSVYGEYEKDVRIHEINAYRFVLRESLLGMTEENKCFCRDKNDCYSSGILDVSVCKRGAPITLSLPHFFLADPKYLNAVEGLNSNKHEHESYLDIEPITGILIRIAMRVQVNVALKPFPHIKLLKDLPKLMLPIMWLNESMIIGPGEAEMIKGKVIRPIILSKAAVYAVIAIGSFILVIAAILLMRNAAQRNKKNTVNSSLTITLAGNPKSCPQILQSEAKETLLRNGYL